jgi:hypothetical protein
VGTWVTLSETCPPTIANGKTMPEIFVGPTLKYMKLITFEKKTHKLRHTRKFY